MLESIGFLILFGCFAWLLEDKANALKYGLIALATVILSYFIFEMHFVFPDIIPPLFRFLLIGIVLYFIGWYFYQVIKGILNK